MQRDAGAFGIGGVAVQGFGDAIGRLVAGQGRCTSRSTCFPRSLLRCKLAVCFAEVCVVVADVRNGVVSCRYPLTTFILQQRSNVLNLISKFVKRH